MGGHAGEDHVEYDPVHDIVLIILYLGILNTILECKISLQSISIQKGSPTLLRSHL